MKKLSSAAVEVLMLLGACLLLPATTWAGSIWGPSFAQVTASVNNVECSTGALPFVASCGTGTILIGSATGSASGFADLSTGDLTVNLSAVGGAGIIAANSKFGETLYFQGGNAQQLGQVTMTVTGSRSGNGSTASAGLGANFLDSNGAAQQTGRGADTAHIGSFCNGGASGTQACSQSDGHNLSVSVSFPLAPEGVFVLFMVTGFTADVGTVNYTDPITVTLPPGVTFTSESGVFLTQLDSTSAPEPSTALLVGILAAGVVGLRRTGRRQI